MKKLYLIILLTLAGILLAGQIEAASARKTGTNEHITTYGGGARRYTSLATWEAIYDVNLTTMWKVAISGKSGAFTLDEVLAFAPSGAAGTYIDDDGSWMIFVVTAGTPAVSDVITGATSLQTATLSSITFSNGVSPVLECYDDAASFNDGGVTFTGATTNSTYFRIIRPAAGQGHDGTPNNGVTFIYTTDATVFTITESYFQMQDIIASLSINSANSRATWAMGGTAAITNMLLVGCMAVNGINIGAGFVSGFANIIGANSGAVDCLAHNNEMYGIVIGSAATNYTTFCYNCTSTNNGGNGFRPFGTAGTVKLYNCLSTNNAAGQDFVSAGTGHTNDVRYSASGDTTADDWGGAGNRISQTFGFANSGGDDFHLASTDTGAKDSGTDLSADATYPFNDDIDWQTRNGIWDIGFDEFTGWEFYDVD